MTDARSSPGPARGPAQAIWLGALGVLLLGLTVLQFRRWMPEVLFGDDLANYAAFLRGAFASHPMQSLSASFAEKFRPVFALVMEALFSSFGDRVDRYMAFNMVLNAVSGLVLACAALRLSGGSRLVASLAAVMTVTSRLSLYQVTQITGIIEGVGDLLFLSMIACLIAFHDDRDAKGRLAWAVAAIAFEWLAVFTHERYLPVVPWMAVMLWLSPNFKRLTVGARIALLGLGVGPLVVNVAYKTLVLHDALLVGTGGTYMSFDPQGYVDRTLQAVLSTLTLNHGPDYLVGHAVTANLATPAGVVARSFVAILGLLAVIALLAKAERGARPWITRWIWPLSFVVLAGLMLIPPIMTIRIEQRWLVQPFALVVLAATWCVGRAAVNWTRSAKILFAALTAASLFVDWSLNRTFPNIFFVSSGRIAGSVKREIVDKGAPDRLIVLAGEDVCNWVLLKGEFFRHYAPKVQATCVNSTDEMDPASAADPRRPQIYSVRPDYSVAEVSAPSYRALVSMGEPTRVDFLKIFDQGRINDERPIGTPTGKGALLFLADSGYGPRRSLTLVSGFTYRFDHVAVRPGDRLVFGAATVFPTARSPSAVVRITGADGRTATAYQAVMPLKPPDGPQRQISASVPLDGYGDDVAVTFAAEAPEGDVGAHWVAFERPRIVPAQPSPAPSPGPHSMTQKP